MSGHKSMNGKLKWRVVNMYYVSPSRVAKVEVVSGVRFMRVGREIGVGKCEV